MPAVIELVTSDQSGEPLALGSAVVVAPNLIVTCAHVLEGARTVDAVFTDGHKVRVGVGSSDISADLALLLVDTGDITPLKLASPPPLGAPVVAIGNPEGLGDTISTGIVSGMRTLNGRRCIQTTAPISHGSSGGALLDMDGRLIGITEAGMEEGENLNFAVTLEYVRHFLAGINVDNGGQSHTRKRAGRKSHGNSRQAEAPQAPPSPPHNAAYYYDLGMELFNHERYGEAETPLRKAVHLEPNNAEYEHRLGIDITYNNTLTDSVYAPAERFLRKAVELQPKNADWLNDLANDLFALNRHDEAESFERRAYAINPHFAKRMGYIRSYQKRYAEAAKYFVEAVGYEPNDLQLQFQAAEALFEAGRYEDAEPYYRSLVAVNSAADDVQFGLGEDLYRQGRYADAEPYYREAARLSPTNFTYRTELAACLKMLGKSE